MNQHFLPQLSIESYIDNTKILYNSILAFLENSEEILIKNEFEKLIEAMKLQKIESDCENLKHFLQIIKHISENHHRERNFNDKINQILLFYGEKIKESLSSDEIFNIFKYNKIIILFLLKNKIMIITDTIYKDMVNQTESNGMKLCHFFYPELEAFAGEEKMKDIKKELIKENPNIFENYDLKRQEGENDSYICSLIRQDSVKEFIQHVNKMNYSLSGQIVESIFETNPFLIENKNITLIQYSAFFGSIQICQYLLMNNVELDPFLMIYAIHSQNAEMIHLLESYQKNNYYVLCLNESIKCHHNDFVSYFDSFLLPQKKSDSRIKEKIVFNCLKYHNYEQINVEDIIEKGFFYLCLYDYSKLVNILLKIKEEEIKTKIISKLNILIRKWFFL